MLRNNCFQIFPVEFGRMYLVITYTISVIYAHAEGGGDGGAGGKHKASGGVWLS